MAPIRLILSLAFAAALSACASRSAEVAQERAADGVAQVQEAAAEIIRPAVEDSSTSVAEVVVPAIVDAREIVQEALPAPEMGGLSVPSPAAVALIVRYEISSPSYYTNRLQRPIWPGASSGVTWGIGYDGGHQTRQRISGDWVVHPNAAELSTTAGIVGQRAKAVLPAYRDIVTPLTMAERVFAESTLPEYYALAERTFHEGWTLLPADAQGSLTATVYNRGAGMTGARRSEMRVLRDECVPRGDTACMAAQFRSMCRIWAGTSVATGLCNRYQATADLAEGRRA